MNSVMFNEALQDLKDRFAGRLTLIHILSRQAQEADLLQGRIDADKVRAMIDTHCCQWAAWTRCLSAVPEVMIDVTAKGLARRWRACQAGAYRALYFAHVLEKLTPEARQAAVANVKLPAGGQVALTVVLDGKSHALRMSPDETCVGRGHGRWSGPAVLPARAVSAPPAAARS
jgi:ring-1,2-phenylacetyl-CoA epoxidase subunit PaaE